MTENEVVEKVTKKCDVGSEAVLAPPTNFAMVECGIYRSAFPQPANFEFLRALELRSIIYLCMEPYPDENMGFVKANNIKLFQFGIEGKTEVSVSIPKDTILNALKVVIDVRNHPVLIHCNGGKHRTGCLVACFHKALNWCLDSVLEEYQKYAGIKSRATDMKFIENFDVNTLRQSLYRIIYQYHGYGSHKRRLLYNDDSTIRKPKITSI